MLVAGLLACALTGGTASAALAQAVEIPPPPTNGFLVDGPVYSTLKAGTKTYVGGNFSAELPPVASGLLAASASGAGALVPGGVPAVTGKVYATQEDGAGGLFVGGDFTKVGTLARRNLAHIKADGSVDAAWNPSPDTPVTKLDRVDSRLAVVGGFTTIGGRNLGDPAPRLGLAVLSAATGAATAFTPPAISGEISAFDAVGGRIYVAGLFFKDDEATVTPIVALDIVTGARQTWKPAFTGVEVGTTPNTEVVTGLKQVAGTVVAALTDFQSDRFGASHLLVGLDPASGALTWKQAEPNPGGQALLVNGSSRVYVFAANPYRNGGAAPYAIDPATGRRVWTAKATLQDRERGGEITSAYLLGNAIYATGSFTLAGPPAGVGPIPAVQERRRAVAFDTGTGALLQWNPRIGYPGGSAIGGLGGRVVIGGAFAAAGSPVGTAGDLVRLNADGSLDPGFPPFSFTAAFLFPGQSLGVTALTLDGSTLYAGGEFSAVAGLARPGLAAIDLMTGKVTSFQTPDLFGGYQVDAIRVYADRVEADQFGVTYEFTKAGAQLSPQQVSTRRLKDLVATLDVPFADAADGFVTLPDSGRLTIEALLPDGSYTVGTTGEIPVSQNQRTGARLQLNAAGRLIRSYYPDYNFLTRATFTPVEGDPITVERLSPAP